MKKIGILGGVGPQATTYIYNKIIENSIHDYGAINNDDYPYLVISSIPIPDFISDKSELDRAKKMLVSEAKNLANYGCNILCIGSNTVHILLDDLKKEVSVPFLSMVELVASECNKLGYKKVGLLGTPVLIESGLYNKELEKYSIKLITPTYSQEIICDEVIRCVIGGKSIDKIKPDYINVLTSMFDSGAEAIILGCTELPLVINYEALGKKIISSDELLARGITEYYYKK